MRFGECFGECFGDWYMLQLVQSLVRQGTNSKKGEAMEKLKELWIRHGTSRNVKVAYVLLVLAALAVAGGAPSGGSGMPGGGIESFLDIF
jgi:hypothetical protein